MRVYDAAVMAPLWERFMRLLHERLGVDEARITGATSFVDDIGADSIDILELVMGLEEEFGITIPDDQAENIKTVGDAIDYIESMLRRRPS
jgi:acyl carrier protein